MQWCYWLKRKENNLAARTEVHFLVVRCRITTWNWPILGFDVNESYYILSFTISIFSLETICTNPAVKCFAHIAKCKLYKKELSRNTHENLLLFFKVTLSMTLLLLFILCEQFMGTWGHIKYVNNRTVYETKFKLTFPRRSLITICKSDFAWKLARCSK